ncbi:hypothetical protein [Gordonia shandongensis]|uniref:hypothetical protein n=1 Tax=Gordonia shandongensis TaxID=376351 RepID=UPI00047B6985|nr:hypothetical protein [Gordonia shandongensis]
MNETGWLWSLSTIRTVVPDAFAGRALTQKAHDHYAHADWDPDAYLDRAERAWADLEGGAVLHIVERDAATPVTADEYRNDVDLYDGRSGFTVRRIPESRRDVFGAWAYLFECADNERRGWRLHADRLRFSFDHLAGTAVPEAQLYRSAHRALALIENPPTDRRRPTWRRTEPTDFQWR